MSDILAVLATNAVAVGIVGYLLRLWLDRLEHAFSRELEKFKAELTKEVTRHSVQTTWNHAKRMDLFARLYEHMVDADFELKALLMNIKIGKQDFDSRSSVQVLGEVSGSECLLAQERTLSRRVLGCGSPAAYKPYVDLAQMAMADSIEAEAARAHLPNRMEEIFAVGDGPRRQVVALFRKHAGLTE